MSYTEWDNCEVELCHRMCDGECHTWYPAVSSSFEHSLWCQSALSMMSWQRGHVECGRILMILATFWKWKWLKFSGGLAPPGPLSLQAYIALHEQGPREVEWHHSVFLTKHSKQWQQSDRRHCPRLTSSCCGMRPLLGPLREMSAQWTLDTSLTWPNIRFSTFRSSGTSTATLHPFQSLAALAPTAG